METGGGGAMAPSEGSACSASSQMSVLTAQLDADSFRAAECRVAEIIHQFVQDVELRVAASLKQAAAEVAAHLAKEAMGRLVAAERKVTFLEQELVTAKEQALSMLLRLKHATDSQVFDLEKRLLVERRRADEAESKVSTLQESLRRVRKKGGQRNPHESGGVQEEDCLALIAGVACDVMHDKGDLENECSSMSEGKERDKTRNEDDPQSSYAGSLAPIAEEEEVDEERVIDEEQNNSDTAREDEAEEEEDMNDSGERRHSTRLRKRRSREIPTSEKLTRLMAGSKRARGKTARGDKDSKKPGVVVETSRDSRRLMQGARQLFSLAERKW